MKVYIPNTMLSVPTMELFKSYGHKIVGLDEADAIILTGGEDINPALYGEDAHDTTYWNSERDEFEYMLYKINLPKIGICRGAQLICAMEGGKLMQDITTPHPSLHDAITNTGEVMQVNSLHHQAVLIDKNMEVLMRPNLYVVGEIMEDGMPLSVDYETAEMFIYNGNLGAQFHPELNCPERARNFFMEKAVECVESWA